VTPPSAPLRLSAALAGRYAIERELGAGGMATVYLADDLRHARKVAIKVLRPELAAVIGAERFLSEIRTTANLQHPHILPLHDSGDADGHLFYVMPYVAGESLRDRLMRERQLPVHDAIRIAAEIGSALDYAHRHGVIHRDIKPENILLHDGRALVADFGIALAASRAGSGTRMTETGMSLGTPHYMSPEQAMGERDISARSDVYALGAITYEMLTGEPPFTGPTAQAIVARVVTEQPRSLVSQRHTIPPHVEAAVLTALEKLPADRFATAADFVAALGNAGFTGSVASGAARAAASASRPRRRELAAGLVLVVGLAALALWGWLRPVPRPAFPVVRVHLDFPEDGAFRDANGSPFALSPDGSKLAYVGTGADGTRRLYLRALDQLTAAPIGGTEGSRMPFFSPDGQWLGFVADGKIRKVALAGGPVSPIADAAFVMGASWGSNELIVFAGDSGLYTVSAAGGAPEPLLTPDSARTGQLRWPEFTPDGRTVVYTDWSEPVGALAAVSLASGESRPLGIAGTNPHMTDTGYLLYATMDGNISAAPFDLGAARATGPARPVAEGIRVGSGGAAKLALSRSGTLVHLAGESGVSELVSVDRKGTATVIPTPAADLFNPRYSPDGRRIAVATGSAAQGAGDVWILDLTLGTLGRITFDAASTYPAWSPDGQWVLFATRRTDEFDLWRVRSDGSGVEEPVVAGPMMQQEGEFTADGAIVIFRETHPRTRRDIRWRRLGPDTTSTALLTTPYEERSPAISPDGRWLAYASDETGVTEVYVKAFPGPGGRIQVSASGGRQPRWSPRGGELLYRVADSVVAIGVGLGGTEPSFGRRQSVHVGVSSRSNSDHAEWDVSPDGQRFLFARPKLETGTDETTLILHLFDRR
jgi:dipeptidyl aminopeptidase/acylaminoacyl peptidase